MCTHNQSHAYLSSPSSSLTQMTTTTTPPYQGVSPLLILYSPDMAHNAHTRAPSPNKPGTQPLPPPAARDGGGWTFVWPHCREVVMTLNILLHVYMAWTLREWVVKKVGGSVLDPGR
jgi:hypothetical protein